MDNTLRLYDRESGHPLWSAPAWLDSMPAALTNGRWIHPDGSELEPVQKTNWLTAIEARARWAVDSPESKKGCLAGYDGAFEVWALERDERLNRINIGVVDRLAVSKRGCLIHVQNRALWWSFSDSNLQTLAPGNVQAIEVSSERLIVALDQTAHIFDNRGLLQTRRPIPTGVTAISASKENLLLGFESGRLAYLPLDPTQTSTLTGLETLMTSAVSRLMAGPSKTIIAGGQDGEVGLWNLETGQRLQGDRLHGGVVHLVQQGRYVHAISELGWRARWDLKRFEQSYCTLLNEVWAKVPVGWQDGRVHVAPPPPNHECTKRP